MLISQQIHSIRSTVNDHTEITEKMAHEFEEAIHNAEELESGKESIDYLHWALKRIGMNPEEDLERQKALYNIYKNETIS